MIELKNIHKSYAMGPTKLHVLKGINATIEKGEMVSIMGSSGSGKSTLLNILGILDGYDEGDYLLAGERIKSLGEKHAAELRNKLIGFVFAVLEGDMLHYWFAFFDTEYMRTHSLGKWLMWRVIKWGKENNCKLLNMNIADFVISKMWRSIEELKTGDAVMKFDTITDI